MVNFFDELFVNIVFRPVLQAISRFWMVMYGNIPWEIVDTNTATSHESDALWRSLQANSKKDFVQQGACANRYQPCMHP